MNVFFSKSELLAAVTQYLAGLSPAQVITGESDVAVIGKDVSNLAFAEAMSNKPYIYVGEVLIDKLKNDRSGKLDLKFGLEAPDDEDEVPAQATFRTIAIDREFDVPASSSLVVFTSTSSENVSALFNGYRLTIEAD